MRKLKFRAWDSKTREMIIQGDLDRIDKILTYYELHTHVHVMQYTGMKDKNGTEIYDCDICKVHVFTQELGENLGVTEGDHEFIAQIKISDKGEGIILDNGKGSDSGPIWSYGGMHEESFEVIGNIYENKGILKLENASKS